MVLLCMFASMSFGLGKVNLFAWSSSVDDLQMTAKVTLLDVVQDPSTSIVELLEMHMDRFGLQTKPVEHLITQDGALGNNQYAIH
jgi:hypothetical protein